MLPMASSTQQTRVIIIGAGWAGLVAAKTYLEINPDINLTVIEAENSIGGVWCAARIYPGFMCDSPSGLFDYSDLSMRDAIGTKDWDDISGEKVHEYLVAYAEKFSLLERVRLNTRASSVQRNQDLKRWDVILENTNEILTCDKLIVATGVTSTQNWPNIPYQDFEKPVIHSRDVGIHYQDLISPKVDRVTVYGGCKSSMDTVNLCVKAGKKVDWVIRDNGNGAGMMLEVKMGGIHGAQFMGRWKNALIPSIFNTEGFWYRIFHSGSSTIGNWLCTKLWSIASRAPFSMSPYNKNSENIKKLMPETQDSLFFTASIAALHGEKTKDFVKQIHSGENIQVHRASITSMSGSTVFLSNGTTLSSDTTVFCTGWDTACKIMEPATAHELGISAPLASENEESTKYWNEVTLKAEAEVLEKLPRLRNPPPYNKKKIVNTPNRLYRYILPPTLAAKDDHSLIFLGQVVNIMTPIISEVSALWGIAWMEGILEKSHQIPSKDEMDYEIACFNSWCSHRYLSRGDTKPLVAAESQDIIDLWMKDLDLDIHRKSWLPDKFLSYRSQDYIGIVQEVLSRSKSEANK